MKNTINNSMEEYCIYLRKSRKDYDAEKMGAGETLARHEKILFDLAKSMNIVISKIHREIVSGESISARPVMQQLLSEVENGLWKGVLVVEVERLARGNTLDQGIVSNTFKYSSTKIITPTKIYDPDNEYDEEYFEFGLFMSRREYKTINRRLHRGTIASIQEGKTVSMAPYGYDKYKLKGKGFSLKPNSNAKNVQLIYEMYTNGKNLGEIVDTLTKLNIPTPKNGAVWYKTTLQKILTNITYIGKLQYIDKQRLKKVVNGSLSYVKNPNPDIYIVDGLHEAIISEETFKKAQSIYKSHQLADTRTKEQFELKNPLSTIMKCAVCGRTLKRHTTAYITNIGCRNYDVGSTDLEIVENKVYESLKQLLLNYKLDVSNYNKSEEIKLSINSIEKQIQQLELELDKINSQKNKLYDLLEQGIYSKEIFLQRSSELANRIYEIKNKIDELLNLKQKQTTLLERKSNIIPNIERVIETYPYASIQEKNKLLKSCIKKIEYYKPKGCRKKDKFTIKIYPKL